MIFSFNDPQNINPILMDRITTVETKYLLLPQKIYIAMNHLLPEMVKEMGLIPGDITFDKETIIFMIDNWTHEGGVRKLKSLLYSIVREINIANLTKVMIDNQKVTLPFNVTIENVKVILKHKREITPEKIHQKDVCGVINGLYATSDGSYGGIIPIQILWFPSTSPLDVKATGNLQQVIKESTQVAASLAFNRLDLNRQEKYLSDWKERPKGIHIHCSEGSTPKDGPSAGTALTVAIYSILTERKIRHDIAITGEINLQGNVTAIGGLDNKLEGAKKAGVKLVLYPKENEKDIIQIKERNPSLIDDDLQVQAIETIDEALEYSLI
jgi:ATP-dependent Lon protease